MVQSVHLPCWQIEICMMIQQKWVSILHIVPQSPMGKIHLQILIVKCQLPDDASHQKMFDLVCSLSQKVSLWYHNHCTSMMEPQNSNCLNKDIKVQKDFSLLVSHISAYCSYRATIHLLFVVPTHFPVTPPAGRSVCVCVCVCLCVSTVVCVSASVSPSLQLIIN